MGVSKYQIPTLLGLLLLEFLNMSRAEVNGASMVWGIPVAYKARHGYTEYPDIF
jgi:hypothetical protein